MLPSNSWCFDLEIINAILNKDQVPEPGIRYCQGWSDHSGMGVSVLVAAKVDGTDLQVFTADPTFKPARPMWEFQQLIAEADLMIGHNSRSFDAKVLSANGIAIPVKKHLDFFHEVKLATKNHFPKGYKLELLSPRCGGPGKTESGALAPYMWQRGEKDRVMEYCKNDIVMTRAVARYYMLNGASIPDLSGTLIRLRTPTAIAMED